MPWKTAGAEDQGRRFLAEYPLNKTSLAELSKPWVVNRTTVYTNVS